MTIRRCLMSTFKGGITPIDFQGALHSTDALVTGMDSRIRGWRLRCGRCMRAYRRWVKVRSFFSPPQLNPDWTGRFGGCLSLRQISSSL
jgi:hypothetical protein